MGYRDYDPIRALQEVTHRDEFGGVNIPLINSVTHHQDPTILGQCFAGKLGPEDDHYSYARFAHPNTEYLGCQISAIENAAWSVTLDCGQRAMATVIETFTKPGDAIVASDRLYGGTRKLLESLERVDVGVRFVDVTVPERVESALNALQPKLFIVEPVSNPSLVAADIPQLAKFAHKAGALCVADNTFMPLAVLPLRLGADIVVHSLTKYVSGQSDRMGGSISISSELPAERKAALRSHIAMHGGVLYHGSAQEFSMRMGGLAMRFASASASALFVAKQLSRHPALRVYYPGLPGYAYRQILKKIMRSTALGYGAVIAVDFGVVSRAEEFLRRLEKVNAGYSAVSLGSAHTYACAPVASVSSGAKTGPTELTPSLVRIAVGYDHSGVALWEKMKKAL